MGEGLAMRYAREHMQSSAIDRQQGEVDYQNNLAYTLDQTTEVVGGVVGNTAGQINSTVQNFGIGSQSPPPSVITCSLTAEPATVEAGQPVKYTIDSSAYGYSAFWKGSENSQPINYQLEDFQNTNYWTKTYTHNTAGTLNYQVQILNDAGGTLCTTNPVEIRVTERTAQQPEDSLKEQQTLDRFNEANKDLGITVSGNLSNPTFSVQATSTYATTATSGTQFLFDSPKEEQKKFFTESKKRVDGMVLTTADFFLAGVPDILINKAVDITDQYSLTTAVCQKAGVDVLFEPSYREQITGSIRLKGKTGLDFKQWQDFAKAVNPSSANPFSEEQIEQGRQKAYELIKTRLDSTSFAYQSRLSEVNGMNEEQAKQGCSQAFEEFIANQKELENELQSVEIMLLAGGPINTAQEAGLQAAKPVVKKVTNPIGNAAKRAWDATLGRIFGRVGKEGAEKVVSKLERPTLQDVARILSRDSAEIQEVVQKARGILDSGDARAAYEHARIRIQDRINSIAPNSSKLISPQLLDELIDEKAAELLGWKVFYHYTSDSGAEQIVREGTLRTAGETYGEQAARKGILRAANLEGPAIYVTDIKPSEAQPISGGIRDILNGFEYRLGVSKKFGVEADKMTHYFVVIAPEDTFKPTGSNRILGVREFKQTGDIPLEGPGLVIRGPFKRGETPDVSKVLGGREADQIADEAKYIIPAPRQTGISGFAVEAGVSWGEIRPEIRNQALEIARRLDKNGNEKTLLSIAQQLQSGLSENDIIESYGIAQSFINRLEREFSAGEISPARRQDILQKLLQEYPGLMTGLYFEYGIDWKILVRTARESIEALYPAVFTTVASERAKFQTIAPALVDTVEAFSKLRFFCLRYLPTFGRSFCDKQPQDLLSVNKIYLVSQTVLDRICGKMAGGCQSGDEIYILRSIFDETLPPHSFLGSEVLIHECTHRYCQILNPRAYSEAHALFRKAFDIPSGDPSEVYLSSFPAAFLYEGLTQYTTQQGFYLSGKVASSVAYQGPVTFIDSQIIPLIMRNSGRSREEAAAVAIEAAFGNFERLYTEVGGGNREFGIQLLRQIIPNTAQGYAVANPEEAIALARRQELIRKLFLAGTGGGLLIGAGAAANSILSNDASQDQNLPNQPKPGSLLPGSLVSEVTAQEKEIDNTKIVSLNKYEYLAKQEAIKRLLTSNQSIDSLTLTDIMNQDFVQTEVARTSTGYTFTSGRTGVMRGEVEKGSYLVDIKPIPDFDIKVPEIIGVKERAITIPISIKEGTGKVEKTAPPTGWQWLLNKLFGQVFAQEKKESQVQLVVFSDTNNNGKIDKNEQVLPWAGLKVELKKVNQDRTLSLISGWNLVSLEVLPAKPLNASTLLQEIAKQGGYATTVSVLENGAWKSFVVRGDKTYSGEDFPISPGKAYFVKALKSSVLVYQGQELVAPIKLNLVSGWNGVGVPYSQKTYSADQLLDTLNSSKAEADTASRWESGLWDTFVKQQEQRYGENFMIEQPRGYLLKVGKGLEFSP